MCHHLRHVFTPITKYHFNFRASCYVYISLGYLVCLCGMKCLPALHIPLNVNECKSVL